EPQAAAGEVRQPVSPKGRRHQTAQRGSARQGKAATKKSQHRPGKSPSPNGTHGKPPSANGTSSQRPSSNGVNGRHGQRPTASGPSILDPPPSRQGKRRRPR